MSQFEVVSVDMFQTLVNIKSRQQSIWRIILEDEYTDDLAREYGNLINQIVYDRFYKDIKQADEFSNLKTIFKFRPNFIRQ